uniref:Uncharacterized protein n=1 Tax=Odontella aurita TaxID=265563 RepID=A0A7S4N9W1_9STRA
MVVPRSVRQGLLMNDWGYSRSQMANAVRDSNRTKTQRRTTVNNLDTPFSKIEEGTQSAKRKVKRILLRRKSDGVLYERWKIEERRARAAIEAEYEAAALSVDPNGIASHQHPPRRVVDVGGSGGIEESKREVEAVGDTFELISVGSDPSSPSMTGHGPGGSHPSPPQSLLPPPAVEPEDSPGTVEEADRGASGSISLSQHSHSRPIVCAEEEDDDEEQLALGAVLAGAEEAAKNAARRGNGKGGGGGSGTIDGSALKNSMAVYLSK